MMLSVPDSEELERERQFLSDLENVGVRNFVPGICQVEWEMLEDLVSYVHKPLQRTGNEELRLVQWSTPWEKTLKKTQLLSPQLLAQLREIAAKNPVMFRVGGAARALKILLSARFKLPILPPACLPDAEERLWEEDVSETWKDVTACLNGLTASFRAIRVRYSGGDDGMPTEKDLRGVRFAVEQEEMRLRKERPYRMFYHGCLSITSPRCLVDSDRWASSYSTFGIGVHTSDYKFATKWAVYESGGCFTPAVVGFAVPLPLDGAGLDDAGEDWRRLCENHKEFPSPPDGEWEDCVRVYRRRVADRDTSKYNRFGLISGPALRAIGEQDTDTDTIPILYAFRNPVGRGTLPSGLQLLRQPATKKFLVLLDKKICSESGDGRGRRGGKGRCLSHVASEGRGLRAARRRKRHRSPGPASGGIPRRGPRSKRGRISGGAGGH